MTTSRVGSLTQLVSNSTRRRGPLHNAKFWTADLSVWRDICPIFPVTITRLGASEVAVTAVAQTAKLFSSLEEIAWTVNSSLDAEIILQSIVRSVTQHSPWRICWVGLVDLIGCKFSMYAEAGFRPPLAEESRTWPLEGSATLLAVRQGKPLCLPDALEQDTFPLVRDDARHYGFRSVLIIPLRLGDAHGAMWFCAPAAGTFSHAETAYASAIGAQATVALRNSHLFQRERELRAIEFERASELKRVNQLVAHQNKLLERLNASHVR